MDKECKKALMKMWFGIFLMFVDLLFVLLGRDEYYGYIENHVLPIAFVALAILISGAMFSSSYLRCLRKKLR